MAPLTSPCPTSATEEQQPHWISPDCCLPPVTTLISKSIRRARVSRDSFIDSNSRANKKEVKLIGRFSWAAGRSEARPMEHLDRGRRSPTDREDFVHEMTERNRSHFTASLLDSMERRTQRTYRYGIGLVCIGATLNWLGFAQGHGYVDPLRYLGVACVISGSFCVCMAMCRWLGRPISVSSHRFQEDERSRQNGDVHVINVAVPMYSPPMHEEYRPCKPPDYDIVTGTGVHGEPPPYDEAIKLSPGALFLPNSNDTHCFSACQASPSHYPHLLRTTGTSPSDPHAFPGTHLETEPGCGHPQPAFTPPPPYDVKKVQARSEAACTSTSTQIPLEPGPTVSVLPKNLLFRPCTQIQSRSSDTSPTHTTQESTRTQFPINLLTTSQSLSTLNSNSTSILFSSPVRDST